MLSQESALRKLHREGQTGLSAEVREHAVRLLDLDDSLYDVQSQRLDVDLVRHVLVRHDGSRVGVYQNYLQTLLLERAARLCACVVELRSLTDNDRTGAYNQYFLDITS